MGSLGSKENSSNKPKVSVNERGSGIKPNKRNIVIVGDQAVGKTSLLYNFMV